MILAQAIFAFLFRYIGRVLTVMFSWATIMLFGRVPQERQIFLTIISFGSVIWLVALLGVAFPWFGVFLLSFVELPPWVDRGWVRLGMLAGMLVIPLVVGGVSLFLLPKWQRPSDLRDKLKAAWHGYPYTLALSLTLLILLVLVPFSKIGLLIRRWSSEHMPVIVEGADYMEVVEDIQQILEQRGWVTVRQPAHWTIRLPTRLMTALAGGAVEKLVAENLTVLQNANLQVLLHPADLVISGRKGDVTRARAAIAELLGFTKAHLTWTQEAIEIEDGLTNLWRKVAGFAAGGRERAEALRALDSISGRINSADLSAEEWEVLFREKCTVELAILGRTNGLHAFVPDSKARRAA